MAPPRRKVISFISLPPEKDYLLETLSQQAMVVV
jgi:hypothetical protein